MATPPQSSPEGASSDKLKRNHARLLRSAFLCVLAIISVCWGQSCLRYYAEDPVDRATDDTNTQLARFERTGDPRPVKAWLFTYRGEGEAMNSYGALVRWSFSHQREFTTLMHSMDKKAGEEFCRSYAFSLADNGQTETFRKAFQGYDDPKLTILKSYLYKAVPWSKETTPARR